MIIQPTNVDDNNWRRSCTSQRFIFCLIRFRIEIVQIWRKTRSTHHRESVDFYVSSLCQSDDISHFIRTLTLIKHFDAMISTNSLVPKPESFVFRNITDSHCLPNICTIWFQEYRIRSKKSIHDSKNSCFKQRWNEILPWKISTSKIAFFQRRFSDNGENQQQKCHWFIRRNQIVRPWNSI